MSDHKTEEVKEEVEFHAITEFFENTPPNQIINIANLCTTSSDNYNRTIYRINAPEIQLHCAHDQCNGVRFFRCISGGESRITTGSFTYFYLTYKCSNCQSITKTFSLAAKVEKAESQRGFCYKFGELPTYGPPLPTKLIKLIGPDRDAFLKGRRCENQGLGIGAFIYYRRVVENQKDRILGQIIKVSEKIGAPADKIAILEEAIDETQFTKALKLAKDAMPESLLINGHSPILLLHSALSEGVHALSDAECLEIAGSVRVVLGELSERLSQALKDEAELTKALSNLMNK